MIKDIDVSDEANTAKLIAILDVFDGLATMVKIAGADIPTDSDCEASGQLEYTLENKKTSKNACTELTRGFHRQAQGDPEPSLLQA